MKKLFAAANHYVESSDWKIIAVSVFLGSLGVFAVTYVPLMKKFFRVLTGKE